MQLFHLLFEELGKRTCSLSHHHSIKYTTFYHSQILTFYHFQILLFFCTFFLFVPLLYGNQDSDLCQWKQFYSVHLASISES